MTTVTESHAERDEAVRHVVDWRLSRLFEGGFEAEDAAALAPCLEVDLYEALRLIERGCPSETAVRILL